MSLLVDNIYFVLPSFTARPNLVDGLPFNSTKGSSNISLGTLNNVNIFSAGKLMGGFLKNSAIAQDTLHYEVEEVA